MGQPAKEAPQIPDEVRRQGSDAVIAWMRTDESGYAEALAKAVAEMQRETGEAALAAAAVELSPEVEENPSLKPYAAQYSMWTPEHKARLTWAMVRERLLANNRKYLVLAQAMHEGGILFGVDEQGNPLVADGGQDPMDLPNCGLNYPDTRLAVYFKDRAGKDPTGYEMFPYIYGGYDGRDKSSEIILAFERFTQKPFVVSSDAKESRASWLESGENSSCARRAGFDPKNGIVYVSRGDPWDRHPERGVRRLLRVTA